MVIVVVLIGIMAVPIGRLAVLNLRGTTQSYILSEALNYAQGSTEEIIMISRNSGFNSITSGYSFKYQIPAYLSRSLTVATDSSDGVVYKRITISVSNGPTAVSYETLLVR